MIECPVCGVAGPEEATGCDACGLPRQFFEAVRDIAEPTAEAKFARALEDLTGSSSPVRPGSSAPPATESQAPALESENAVDQSGPPTAPPRPSSAADPEDSPSPSEEALRIGQGLGLDLSDVRSSLEKARAERNAIQIVRLHRDLVRAVLNGLVERYRQLCIRRDALTSRVRTQALDVELTAYRKALSGGELARAEAQRGKAQGTVESIEASWARIKTQFAEAGQMMRALREMGGVAPSVLRPVAEAIRIPRRGEAGQIEHRMKRANGILWGLLVPRMNYQISRGRSLLNEAKAPSTLTEPIRSEIARMADNIRDQKIGQALESRLFLRVALTSLGPRNPKTSVRRSFIE